MCHIHSCVQYTFFLHVGMLQGSVKPHGFAKHPRPPSCWWHPVAAGAWRNSQTAASHDLAAASPASSWLGSVRHHLGADCCRNCRDFFCRSKSWGKIGPWSRQRAYHCRPEGLKDTSALNGTDFWCSTMRLNKVNLYDTCASTAKAATNTLYLLPHCESSHHFLIRVFRQSFSSKMP